MKQRSWYIFFFLIVSLIFIGCGGNSEEEKASNAAKELYDSLFAGRADLFIDGHYDTDSMPEQFRQERIDNAKMFVQQQKEEHNGVHSVRISRAEVYDSLSISNVFLVFCYGDSTNEEIVVPMIKKDKRWMLR